MGYFHSFMNGMYLSISIFIPRFMKIYKVVSKTTLEYYCYYFLRGTLQCVNSARLCKLHNGVNKTPQFLPFSIAKCGTKTIGHLSIAEGSSF
jgi:hypothetical protein